MKSATTLSYRGTQVSSKAYEVTIFLFCLGAYFVLITIFASSSRWALIDHIYTSFFLGTLLIPVTINDLWLRRRYLNQRSYGRYLMLLTTTILLGTWFNQVFFSRLIDYILPDYYFISYYDYVDLLKFFVAFVGIALLIGLSVEWFQLKEAQSRILALEKEKTEAELKSLINQINPHFLFNSLTILYSLALHQARDTGEAILKLSDILRYVIYQSKEKLVTVGAEINLIRDYIALQRYRVPAGSRIDFQTNVDEEMHQVPPMLFLPLVENSFKHGVHGDNGDIFVDIVLEVKNGVVRFSIENTRGESGRLADDGGVGLTNIRERLQLMFPGRSELRVEAKRATFRVDLTILPA